MKKTVLLSLLVASLSACTPQMEPSGMHTSDPQFIIPPTTTEEIELVDNELATQRATRRSGHGFTYKADPGRLRCYYCHGYYYGRHYW